MKTATAINEVLTLTKIERFERINIHIRGSHSVVIDGVRHYGQLQYFGVVWFENSKGERFVSFVKKSTKLWQTVREAEIGTQYNVLANVKEFRHDDEHGERTVITHVRLS